MSTINILSVLFVAALLQTLKLTVKPSLCPSWMISHEFILKYFEHIPLQISTYLSVLGGHFAESVIYHF